MKRVLLLHPADSFASFKGQYDLVVDLGRAPASTYADWTRQAGCPVVSASQFRNPARDLRQLREIMRLGMGQVLDENDLDWWDLISVEFNQQMEHILQLRNLVSNLGPSDEVSITRSGFHPRVLQLLLDRPVQCLSFENGVGHRIHHYTREIAKFSPAQLLQILGDKYDAGYRFRRLGSARPKKSQRPVVLMPSAYVNVSRTELQYAAMLPDSDFLLVATRRSGWVESGLPNVTLQSLASYACGDKSRREFEHLLTSWEQLKSDLTQHDLASVLIRSGAMDSFPKFLRDGLMIRDAWLQVFEQQPVQAVLSADDANFSTRIPLLIAKARGIPAVSCHHGALDGRHRFRPKQDCVFLAKSRMERDYMVHWCGVPEENVELGAPRRSPSLPAVQSARKRSIIFFSEPYEAMGGRCLEFYREILSPLAETAAAAGTELVVKLHPAESRPERTGFVAQVLSNAQKDNVHIVSGPLTDELLSHAWFAVTILSTTAVDCTLRGIPVFLCQWLEYSEYEYVQQFAKFGAGIVLHSADELRDIPKLIGNVQPSSTNDLWNPITPDRLNALLISSAVMAEAV